MDHPIWKTRRFEVAEKEARKILSDNQYAYAVLQIKALAYEENPRMPSGSFDVKSFGPFAFGKERIKFFELRDKGGILGKINLRTFFSVHDERELILVLGCYNKTNDGSTPRYVVDRIRGRLAKALETNFRGVR